LLICLVPPQAEPLETIDLINLFAPVRGGDRNSNGFIASAERTRD
jgi:hypothetical protein